MYFLIEAASKRVLARFQAEDRAMSAGKSLAKEKKKALALIRTDGSTKPIARFYPIGVMERARAHPTGRK